MHNFLKGILFLLGVCLLSLNSWGQKTIVEGRVFDAQTQEPLPFVNIAFEEGKVGTTTNMDGYYKIETYYNYEVLQASFVGYATEKVKVEAGGYQKLDFYLKTVDITLDEFVVKPDKKAENPAHPIVRGVIRNKKVNDREKLEAYEYEVYNKIEFDINNISDKLRDKKVLKPFAFVFEQIDTTAEKPYLPIFISESISDYHYRRNPKNQKEIIKATRISGLENNSVSTFLGDMYQRVNVYENSISVFGKPFISPISNLGFVYYKYYLLDSLFIDENWCYEIKFIPKSYFEPTFDGTMWINDTTYAVKKIHAELAEHANINFVKHLVVDQEFKQVQPEVWMLTKDNLLVDFNPFEKSTGLYGRKKTSYRNFVINQPRSEAFFEGPEDVVIAKDVKKEKSYWDDARHDKLTEQEEAIYAMVDSVKNVPAFNSIVDVLNLVLGGYENIGKYIEVGPYFNVYSFNPVEGHRFRLGMRNTYEWAPRLRMNAFGAYGTVDQKWKYGGGLSYLIKNTPRRQLGANYRSDVAQLGQAQDLFLSDNIFASVFRRNPANKLNLVEELSGFYFHEWFAGFSTRLGYSKRNLYPLGALEFIQTAEQGSRNVVNRVGNEELQVGFRFAFKETFVNGDYTRVSLGSKWPIFELHYFKGLRATGFPGFDYEKWVAKMSHNLRVGQLGVLEYQVEVGKISGEVAFPFLEIHRGNETFFFDKFAFNTMNYFEFMSDQYAQVMAEHHFHGFFLNKFPLLRRLKMREVVTFKAVTGSLANAHSRWLEFPNGFNRLSKPFIEGAVGIENILAVLRVDMIYRLSHRDNPNIIKYGLRARFQIDF